MVHEVLGHWERTLYKRRRYSWVIVKKKILDR